MDLNSYNLVDFVWIYSWIFHVLLLLDNSAVCEEYCFGQDFLAECNSSEVILMQKARYGRMYSGKCITADEDSLGCYGNVIDYLDQTCSGQVQCSYPVQKLDEKVLGCYQNDRLRFLDATYTCIQVPNHTMCIQSRMAFNNSDFGYLNGPWNPPADDMHQFPGTETCPWQLTAQLGQQIQITLIDLSLRKVVNALEVGLESQYLCPIRMRVSDAGDTLESPLCHDSYERAVPLYTSTGSDIQVYVIQDRIVQDEAFYLFHYQVIGCVDPTAPDNTWIQREDDKLTVKCNTTGDTWYLVCRDNEWFGHLGNCTVSSLATTTAPENSEGFPWGIVIAVAIGIAIGVIVGLLMLGIVIAVIKWREGKKKTRATQRPDLRSIEVPYNTTAQMQKNQHDNVDNRQGSTHGTTQPVHYPSVNTYPEQSSLYQPGPSQPQHHYSTASDSSNPMYHFYDQQNQDNLGKSGGLEKQSTMTTEPDDHVYETAYFTRPPTMGKENDKGNQQKTLAKEYHEMRESPQGTLESVINKNVHPAKY